MFGSRNQFEVDGRTVIITGGSDGMGRAVAIQLAEKGANVVVVARTVEKLQKAVESMKTAASNPERQRFHYISADLTEPNEAARVLDEVTKWNNEAPPDIVWCCAGYCIPGFFVETSVQTLRDQMDTVYWTAAYIAHATLRKWLVPTSRGKAVDAKDLKSPLQRHLVFTSSVLAFVAIPGYDPYSPAKAAMRSLSDTLCQEVELYNGARRNENNAAPPADVKIHTIFPTGILSTGFENEQKLKPGLTKAMEEADKPQTPEEVAGISIKRLEKGDYLITTSFIGRLMSASTFGASPRNSIILDNLISWVGNIVFHFVGWDLRKQAWNWGQKHGIPGVSTKP